MRARALSPVRSTAKAHAGYTLAGFRKFCKTLVLENGKTLVLSPYEIGMLTEHFAGAIETVIIIGKKNGKTTLLGALALYHLDTVPDAEVVIGAASRDQATILFQQAVGLVKRSGLEGRFDVQGGYRKVRLAGEKDGARIRVLASDADTGDGVIPTLALVDELHRHPSGELYGVFRDGLTPRQGQMITISTAGSAMDSPLGVLRAKAHALPSFHRDHATKKNYAKSPDGSFVWHEWCLDSTDDVDDMKTVKLVNPAPWHTLKALRQRHDSPSTTPWQWLRFACCIWTEGEEPWLEPKIWDDLAEPGLEIEEGSTVVVGVDLGLVKQDSAIVLVAQRGEEFVSEAFIYPPPMLVTSIEAELTRIRDSYDVTWFAYDPTNFRHSAEVLEERGLPMLEFPQSVQRMGDASATLLRVVQEGSLHHSGDGAFRAHVLAGTTKQHERGWRLVKDPRTRRSVGALIALAMAVDTVSKDSGKPYIEII